MTKNKRAQIDWEAIENDYRTGRYSVRQLAEKYDVNESSIRYRIKKYAWSKDLSGDVKKRIDDKLYRNTIDELDDADDETLVEAHADKGIGIIKAHRTRIERQRSIVETVECRLIGQLENEKRTVVIKGEPQEVDLDLEYAGKVLNSLTQSTERLIKLERQSYRLDVEDGPQKPEEKLTDDQLEDAIRSLTSKHG